MRSWTWSEVKTKIQNDLDLTDETFISSTEMLGLVNEAIDDVEAVIHNLYEDYFLTEANIALVNGTSVYSYPSDIYAQKVRCMLYDNGSKSYEIRRLKRLTEIPDIEAGEDLRWRPINSLASGHQIKFHPTPAETSSTNVTIHYIRNARQITANADVIDIPEFMNVIIQHVKVRCMEKELHPQLMVAQAKLAELRQLMIDTLSNRTDDEQDHVEMDKSFYDDFDSQEAI